MLIFNNQSDSAKHYSFIRHTDKLLKLLSVCSQSVRYGQQHCSEIDDRGLTSHWIQSKSHFDQINITLNDQTTIILQTFHQLLLSNSAWTVNGLVWGLIIVNYTQHTFIFALYLLICSNIKSYFQHVAELSFSK